MEPFDAWGRNWWTVDVAGVHRREDAVQQLFPDGVPDDGGSLDSVALLFAEPSNPFDAHAVRVEIDGQFVGYLPALSEPDLPDDPDQMFGALQDRPIGGVADMMAAALESVARAARPAV